MNRRTFLPIGLVLFVLVTANFTNAQVRSSNNYQIESDSINFGGGLSSSTSYIQESTFGEVATGESTSESYALKAGYQQMLVSYLAMSTPSDVALSPDIGGVSGGVSNGSTSVVVKTDNRAGYQLFISASNNPAMQSLSSTIADYAPAGANADTVFTTTTSDAHFGFSVDGVDTAARYLVSGSVCGSGIPSTTACWDGLSTSLKIIADRSSANHPDGSTTTLSFKVGIGSSANQLEGDYTATSTVTLLPL